MQTIFGNDRLDRGNLPDLMTLGSLIVGHEFTATTTAGIRTTVNDFIAAFWWHQLSGMLFVALLSTPFEL